MAAESVDIVVIGAGVSGLSFANWWRECCPSDRVLVLEAEATPGGYCKTVIRSGFVWDYSGHFFHFKDPAVEAWLRSRMREPPHTVQRVAKIRYADRDIDFPFQSHIHQLPHDEFLECLVDLYFRPHAAHPASFADMLYQRLGRAITDKFLRPYNEKLYATRIDELDVDAMGRFFPQVDFADVIANMRPGGRATGYNATFTYPAGGAIEYIHALLADLDSSAVSCGEPVIAIDLDAHIVTTPRRTISYRRVVSCAPLPTLARLSRVAHAPVFSSNKVLVWNLGFDRKGATDIHWMYFPDPSIAFYRVGWYDNILGGNAKATGHAHGRALASPSSADRMSLYVEVGAASNSTVDAESLRARILADLRRVGIVTDHQLVAEHHVVLDPGYVHITKASLAETRRLRDDFAARSVYTVGRYGGWTYCSIEDNMIETRDLAKRLMSLD